MAFVANFATIGLAIVMAAVLRSMLKQLNEQLDKDEAADPAAVVGSGESMEKGFRFLL